MSWVLLPRMTRRWICQSAASVILPAFWILRMMSSMIDISSALYFASTPAVRVR